MALSDPITSKELADIKERLERGENPDQIAEAYGVSRPTLVTRLLMVGKRIVLVTTRQLEDVGSVVEADHDLAAAQR